VYGFTVVDTVSAVETRSSVSSESLWPICLPLLTQSSALPLYAQENGNYIWVTMNYRLGHFGFLAGSEIAAGGALNAGLRESLGVMADNVAKCAPIVDQQAALQWVQTNIAKASPPRFETRYMAHAKFPYSLVEILDM
jgi:hypothetical protein